MLHFLLGFVAALPAGSPCTADSQCDGTLTCVANVCAAAAPLPSNPLPVPSATVPPVSSVPVPSPVVSRNGPLVIPSITPAPPPSGVSDLYPASMYAKTTEKASNDALLDFSWLGFLPLMLV